MSAELFRLAITLSHCIVEGNAYWNTLDIRVVISIGQRDSRQAHQTK